MDDGISTPTGETYVSRWGDPELDSGYVWIPGFILRRCAQAGVSPTELAFITQVMSFKYDTENGAAYPSLRLIGERLGRSADAVRRIKNSLQKKGLLLVIERTASDGGTLPSEMNFGPLVRKCRALEAAAPPPAQKTPPPGKTASPPLAEMPPKDIEDEDIELSTSTGAQSAPVNGGDDEQPETPKRRKKREAKPRPRDEYIDALAECAFNVPPGQPIGKQTGGRCAAVKAELLAVYDKLQPEHIRAAYQWYAKAHPDMSPPRDAVKVLAMVGEFRQALEAQKAKQAQPKKPLVLDPPLYDPVWPEIDRDHTGRYVGPNGGNQ